MTTDQTNILREAIEKAIRDSPPLYSGDSNLIDVCLIVQKIQEVFNVKVPSELPPKNEGVLVFECVEKHLLADPHDRVLRNIPVADVVQRIVNLGVALVGMLPFSHEQNLVASLYAWHGCIHMGKLLRCVHNAPQGPTVYTAQMRREGYAHIKEEWRREESRANPWVRYGVSLARRMEQTRKKQEFDFVIHENWIPKDSPYWE